MSRGLEQPALEAVARGRQQRQQECGGSVEDSLSFDGYTARVIARDQGPIIGVASDGARVFWAVGELGKESSIRVLEPGASSGREVARAPTSRALAVHAGTLFWLSFGTQTPATVMSMPVTGAAPRPFAEAAVYAIDTDALILATNHLLMRAPLDGTTPTRFAELPEDSDVIALAVSDDAIWALSDIGESQSAVFRISRASGEVERRADVRLGATLTIAGEDIAYTTLTETWVVPRAGGSPKMIGRIPLDPTSFVTAGTRAYGVSDCGGVLSVVDHGHIEPIVRGLGVSFSVAIMGEEILVADSSSGLILAFRRSP
ncbi:MAG: hypothetical protein JWO36_4758 [Myxococcales bacterium]|nr:hypothetical protein [Myxococcales bacterium]